MKTVGTTAQRNLKSLQAATDKLSRSLSKFIDGTKPNNIQTIQKDYAQIISLLKDFEVTGELDVHSIMDFAEQFYEKRRVKVNNLQENTNE